MVVGKIIGGLLGLFSGGLFVAIIGIIIGHFFDRSVGASMRFDFGAERQRLQQLFFETAFSVMGHIAKADGRISEAEIAQAEAIITRVGLTQEHRQQAIAFFKQGAEPSFQLQPVVSRFVSEGGKGYQLPTLLMEFLISMALADGELHPAEREVLINTASYLGIPRQRFEQLLTMLLAQQDFGSQGQYSHGANRTVPSQDALSKAYQALGVEASISDRDLKKAYRRLMSEHHPDKLMAKGLPEDMVKIATEKSQEIQAAYEMIKRSRKA